MTPTNVDLFHSFKRVGHIPNQHYPSKTQVSVTLWVDSGTALEFSLFETEKRSLSLDDFYYEVIDKTPVQFVAVTITAPLNWWGRLCKTYPHEQVITDLEDFFYKNYLKGWVQLGLV